MGESVWQTIIAPAGINIPLNDEAGDEKVHYNLSFTPIEYTYESDSSDYFVHAGVDYQLDLSGPNNHIFKGHIGAGHIALGVDVEGGVTHRGDPVFGIILSAINGHTPPPFGRLTLGYQAVFADKTEHSLTLNFGWHIMWN